MKPFNLKYTFWAPQVEEAFQVLDMLQVRLGIFF